MKISLPIRLLFTILCALTSLLHAELLIVKHGKDYLVPLDVSDTANYPAIAHVLLSYQWPMVIMNTTLTNKERDELLSPDKPYAEEEFIRTKLQAINPDYDVAFLPTALYELFVASYYKDNDENILHREAKRLDLIYKDPISNGIKAILTNPEEKKETEYQHIYDVYRKYNMAFYKDVFFSINNALTTFIFNKETIKTVQELTNFIKKNALEYAAQWIIDAKPTMVQARQALPILMATLDLNEGDGKLPQNSTIPKVFALEYEARSLNKGILLRGSRILEVSLGASKGVLAGTPLYEDSKLYKKYKEKSIYPYSISFGNSLFAGAFNDFDATVYTFFRGGRGTGVAIPLNLGYALLIDKKAYIKSHLQNLFFIAPLASSPAFFGAGEFFHSRTKNALALKEPGKSYHAVGIGGLGDGDFVDPAGVLFIQRDPLRHAELFSDFLAKNMRIIYFRDKEIKNKLSESLLTSEETKAYEEHLKKEQAKAANFYRAIPRLERFATKASQTFRQRKLEKKQKEEVTKSSEKDSLASEQK